LFGRRGYKREVGPTEVPPTKGKKNEKAKKNGGEKGKKFKDVVAAKSQRKRSQWIAAGEKKTKQKKLIHSNSGWGGSGS